MSNSVSKNYAIKILNVLENVNILSRFDRESNSHYPSVRKSFNDSYQRYQYYLTLNAPEVPSFEAYPKIESSSKSKTIFYYHGL